MLILIGWHKTFLSELWHASSNMQIHKSTGYKGCLISLRPKVEDDVLYSCKLARLQIYSTDENTESLKLTISSFFLLRIIKHSQLAVSNLLDLENGKLTKLGIVWSSWTGVVFQALPAKFEFASPLLYHAV